MRQPGNSFAALVAVTITAGAVAAQTPPPSAGPSFDIVSVKANRSGDSRIGFETPPGRVRATNIPLRFLIRQAYRVPAPRIVGGPAWLDTDRYDIVATSSAEGSTPEKLRQMMRALLADRFKVAVHTESRELPVYLLVARADGKLGPHLRRSTTDCSGAPRVGTDGRVQCGVMISQGPASASLRGGATSLAEFARILGDFVDRPLVDRTLLTGNFDVELQFTADQGAVPGVPGGLASANATDIPVIFTALEEQLGLHLSSQRGIVEVLVIDNVSKPTDD